MAYTYTETCLILAGITIHRYTLARAQVALHLFILIN